MSQNQQQFSRAASPGYAPPATHDPTYHINTVFVIYRYTLK